MRRPKVRVPDRVRCSLTVAQYRMLGRIVHGVLLPLDRYRREHSTVAALARKGCIMSCLSWLNATQVVWLATPFGKEVHAAKGKLRWPDDAGEGAFAFPRSRVRVLEYK